MYYLYAIIDIKVVLKHRKLVIIVLFFSTNWLHIIIKVSQVHEITVILIITVTSFIFIRY